MTELALVPEWLKDLVQPADTCWSSREGLEMCEDGEAYWEEVCSVTQVVLTSNHGSSSSKYESWQVIDYVLCPECAKDLLTDKGRFSNGVLVRKDEWNDTEIPRRQRITPFAKRPANRGELCMSCSDSKLRGTYFYPELGGWVPLVGNGAPDEEEWLEHENEIPVKTILDIGDIVSERWVQPD